MPFPLYKSPRGLLEALKLRTVGKNPDRFSEMVQPTVDVLDMYTADVLFTAAVATGAAAYPFNSTLDVAFTRRFLGVSASITMGAAPGTRLTIRIGVAVPSSSSPAVIVAYGAQTAPFLVAGGNFSVFALFPRPLVLTAGCQIVTVAESDAAGADHQLSVRFLSDNLSPN